MKAFVTGGSGFVGRNMIALLCEQGHSVRALARTPAAAAQVTALGAEAVQGDLDDLPALTTGMQGCDVVFHSAAYVKDWGPEEEFMRVNVGGTERVLAAARNRGVPRFVHVGTEAVLVGGPPIVNADETWPLPKRPIGPYPLTKGLAERRVLAANSAELATMVVRPRFIWGRGDSSLLPELVDAVRSGRFRWIDGGRYLTSTCHVSNVCEGMLLCAERGRGGEVYFLTDGEPTELRSFMEAMLASQGVQPGSSSIPRWLARAVASGAETVWSTLSLKAAPPISRTAVRLIGEEVTVNDAKARRELGYVAKVSRQAGLAAMAGG